MPPGWATFWLVAGDSTHSPIADEAFPVPVLWTDSWRQLVRRGGVSGVPYHFVLDTTGRLVSRGLGGELLPRAAFRSDCSIETGVAIPTFTMLEGDQGERN